MKFKEKDSDQSTSPEQIEAIKKVYEVMHPNFPEARENPMFQQELAALRLWFAERVRNVSGSYSKLMYSLDECEISKREHKALSEAGYILVGEVIQLSSDELLKIPGFGKESLKNFNEFAEVIGFPLGMQLPQHIADAITQLKKEITNK